MRMKLFRLAGSVVFALSFCVIATECGAGQMSIYAATFIGSMLGQCVGKYLED